MPTEVLRAPVFDPTAIEKLRTVAGDQGSTFVAEMAELFLEETRKLLPELQAGCDGQDWKAVSRLAHSLKSSAATLGAMRLSAACRILELDTSNGEPKSDAAGLVAEVMRYFEEAEPVLKNLQ